MPCPRVFDEFDQHALAPFWVQEDHAGSSTSGSGFGVQEGCALRLQALDFALEVRHTVRGVVQTRTALLKKRLNG